MIDHRRLIVHNVIRRPLKAPQVAIPCAARSVGFGYFPPGEIEVSQAHHWAKISCCLAGEALVNFGMGEQVLRAGEIAVFMPDELHSSRASETAAWECRWWTLDGPMLREILTSFGFPAAGIYHGRFPSETRFQELRRALLDVTPAGEYRAGSLAYEMLGIAAQAPANEDEDPLLAKALDIIEARWQDADFGVEVLARDLDMHRSQLSRRFTQRHGLSPVQYLIRLRIQRAANLLRQGDEPIASIAERCGYPDAAYFSRCFKRIMGIRPGDSRTEA